MNCRMCGESGHESNENQQYLCIQYLRAQRDQALKYAAPVDATASVPRHKQCAHNEYWTTHYGNCMACRAEVAELQLRDMKAILEEIVKANSRCDTEEKLGMIVTNLMHKILKAVAK